MERCPRCGSYMTFNMRYNAGCPVVEYNCSCGYSTSDEYCTTDNKTYMNNDDCMATNHT